LGIRGVPEFVCVDFASLFFVENAEHVAHFSLLFVVADLLAHDTAELFERHVAGTCTPAVIDCSTE